MTDKAKLKKIKKLADAMYYSAFNLTTDASLLRKAMEEYHQFIIHEWREEPVSDELEEASKNHAVERFRTTRDEFLAEKCKWSFKAGANWQKQQDESKVLMEEQCRKICDDAFELGKDAMKQQLMTKAVDATVHIDAGGYPYIPQMELHDYGKDIPLAKEGDKYKVILIKEG